jgi:hypothetical protein
MSKTSFLAIVTLLIFTFQGLYSQGSGINGQWKAGVAKTVITPKEPMWMAGYGSRDHPSEGIIHDLWAKVLAIQDARGKKALLITTDLESFPKSLSDRIRNRLGATYGLTRAQIILNSSHTHSGPVVDGMYNIYTDDPAENEKIKRYSKELENKLIGIAGEAIAALKPANIFSGNGVTRFQVNRRNNDESKILEQTEINGPNDYAVPVLKVTGSSGELIAVAFGYACHNTTLSGYEWCGDYAGFAQIELEKMHPGTTAMFFQGAGADQNPLPRRSVYLAQQYGRSLAAAAESVISGEMHPLSPELTTVYSEINLGLSPPMPKEELVKMAEKSKGYQKHWAEDLIHKMETGEKIISEYPYPIQVWKLGEQAIFSFGGELVVDYTIKLKEKYGWNIFVLGYSNDVMAYIPSTVILKEGGYEGFSSQIAFGLPSVWKENIEETILEEADRLAGEVGLEENPVTAK